MTAPATRTIRTWRLVHTWSSVVCTAFLLMLCITGLPLIFRDEIDDIIYGAFRAPEMPRVGSEASSPPSLDRIVAAARERYPDRYIRTLFWDDGDPNVIKVSALPSADAPSNQVIRLAFDARTGEFIGHPPIRRGVMSFLLGLHRDMLIGLSGTLFLGFMGLSFVLAIVSGVVLYGPFMRRLPFGTVRTERSAKVFWLDIHNLIGITTALWALVIGATGALNTLSIPLTQMWRNEMLPALLQPHRGKPALSHLSSVDAAADAARRSMPDARIANIVFPNNRFGSPRHYLIWMQGETPLSSRISTPVLIDAETGAVSLAQPRPWYLQAIEISRPLHFGDFGGMPLKIVWGALDIATIVLLLTGLYLFTSRQRRAAAQRRH